MLAQTNTYCNAMAFRQHSRELNAFPKGFDLTLLSGRSGNATSAGATAPGMP
jgi:hypothetical protein